MFILNYILCINKLTKKVLKLKNIKIKLKKVLQYTGLLSLNLARAMGYL